MDFKIKPAPVKVRATPGPNEFDPIVQALIEAGEGQVVELPAIPAEDVDKTKRKITGAAHRADKSARFTVSEGKNGSVIEFKLTPKIVKRTAEQIAADEAAEADAK